MGNEKDFGEEQYKGIGTVTDEFVKTLRDIVGEEVSADSGVLSERSRSRETRDQIEPHED
jgi:hypothetical protein